MSEVNFPPIFPTWKSNAMSHLPQPLKDLTKAEWKYPPNTSGTAIYWLTDEQGSYEQIFLPDVIYDRGKEFALALSAISPWSMESFKWVPENVEQATSLIQAQCGGPCADDLDCVNNSCKCIDGFCRRK
jgi:hypothetical protein